MPREFYGETIGENWQSRYPVQARFFKVCGEACVPTTVNDGYVSPLAAMMGSGALEATGSIFHTLRDRFVQSGPELVRLRHPGMSDNDQAEITAKAMDCAERIRNGDCLRMIVQENDGKLDVVKNPEWANSQCKE